MQDKFSEIMRRLSENAQFSLQRADYYSKRYNDGFVGTEHLLMGLVAQETAAAANLLSIVGVTLHKIEDTLKKPIKDLHGAQMAMMSLSEATILTLRIAAKIADGQHCDEIGTAHLLYALVTQPNAKATRILLELEVDLEKLSAMIEEFLAENQKIAQARSKKAEFAPKRNLRWLRRFGRDLTDLAQRGQLDRVIGREAEIDRVITVLCRRLKSNPVLIGEAGVGKTAIVEGLAAKIAKNDVPSKLIGKRIFQVDLSDVLAGTKFRGEFEERIKGLIDEAVENDSVLLFIDELHLLVGTGSGDGSMDAANILKPALARGQLCLIGATTLDEYRKHIEKDKALSRRFQTVLVEEPDAQMTLKILKGIKKHYEDHHRIKIPDTVLETAINMSARYISDRFMPDKVIDVIDEASAITKVAADRKGASAYKKLKIERTELEQKLTQAAEAEEFETAAKYKTQVAQIDQKLRALEKRGADKEKIPLLTEENLALAISLKTGIPVSRVHGSELSLLLHLEEHLNRSIIGQAEAVKVVAKAIRRGRSGITDSRRPIGSFLFMGPTGVGKTELARVIAREVFGGENALIKIDMSEFGEKHNVSRLVGAPAGYIGYDDGGKLTEAVRRKPYSVILFDEIEKAHPEVFNILLQILEDGVLTDGQGNQVKFNNSIVILTSNLGAKEMAHGSELGFTAHTASEKRDLAAEYAASKVAARRALEKVMRPELINRFDAILTFRPLSRADVSAIFDNLLEDLKKRLANQSLGLKVTPEVKKHLIKLGYDPKNGARPLRRTIEDQLESLISESIISGHLAPGDIAAVSLSRSHLKLGVENG